MHNINYSLYQFQLHKSINTFILVILIINLLKKLFIQTLSNKYLLKIITLLNHIIFSEQNWKYTISNLHLLFTFKSLNSINLWHQNIVLLPKTMSNLLCSYLKPPLLNTDISPTKFSFNSFLIPSFLILESNSTSVFMNYVKINRLVFLIEVRFI